MQIDQGLIKDMQERDHFIQIDLKALERGGLSEQTTEQIINTLIYNNIRMIEDLTCAKLLLKGDRTWNTGDLSLEKFIEEALHTEGAHHKQYYLNKIAEMLNIQVEDAEKGIAP